MVAVWYVMLPTVSIVLMLIYAMCVRLVILVLMEYVCNAWPITVVIVLPVGYVRHVLMAIP